MPRGRPRKDPFADVPKEWIDAVASASADDIRRRVAETALAEQSNLQAMRDDQDLAEKKEAVKLASEGYREATKVNTQKIRYAQQVLRDRGEKA
ncbi:MAG: hypothetical protein KGL39_40630 [Patescibacteria group bacterium]|nr:hypothetical protein [Patescibacteria group bacterium]